jgi:hypothetical protein
VEADLALLHEVRRVGQGQRDVDALLDEDDRRPLVADGAHDFEELLDDHRRQTEGELVDHEHLRFGKEGHAERQHLLLATRQVGGGFVETLAKDREHLLHDRESFLGPPLVILHPGRDSEVLAHGQCGEHALAARHHGDAEGGDLVRRRVGDVTPVEDDRPVAWLRYAGDRLEQG